MGVSLDKWDALSGLKRGDHSHSQVLAAGDWLLISSPWLGKKYSTSRGKSIRSRGRLEGAADVESSGVPPAPLGKHYFIAQTLSQYPSFNLGDIT